MNDRDVVIVSGARTPFVKSGKGFKNVHPAELGKVVLKRVLDLTNISHVDEVIIGNTANPSDAANISRVIALRSGLDKNVSAYTVHRNCASALQSVASAYDKIKSGQCDVVIAGGVENMSQMPLMFNKTLQDLFVKFSSSKTIGGKLDALLGLRLKHLKPRIAILEGLTDPFCGLSMGGTAEVLAREFKISRHDQDKFALNSHKKASSAIMNGRFKEEITPVFVPPGYSNAISEDVGVRYDQTMEALERLKPFFDKKYGSVTAGNSCPMTDGAAMLVLMSYEKANSLGLKPLAKIRSYAFCGLDPRRMGLGPVFSSALALKKANLNLKDINTIELNEAFAAQVLACMQAFDSDKFAQDELGLGQKLGDINDRLNPNGGAIALGHPVGATGSRLVLTLAFEMMKKQLQFGLATLCVGGGQGGAMILERV